MRVLAAILLAAGCPAASLAYPEGAPWGHAGVDGGADCTACHFQFDAVTQSERISIDGLPAHYAAGETYELTIRLSEPGAANGFQLAATCGQAPAGAFAAADAATEAEGAAIRSAETADSWRVRWTAPEAEAGPVRFWIAVNFSNDDQSEFGDRIHTQSFDIAP